MTVRITCARNGRVSLTHALSAGAVLLILGVVVLKVHQERAPHLLFRRQVALLNSGSYSQAERVMNTILEMYPEDTWAESAVVSQAVGEGSAAGVPTEKWLQIWSAAGQPEPRRQIAWFAWAYLPARDDKWGEAVHRLGGFARHYRTGYWAVEAKVRIAETQLVYLGNPWAAQCAAREGLALGGTPMQRDELTTALRAAIKAVRATANSGDVSKNGD